MDVCFSCPWNACKTHIVSKVLIETSLSDTASYAHHSPYATDGMCQQKTYIVVQVGSTALVADSVCSVV